MTLVVGGYRDVDVDDGVDVIVGVVDDVGVIVLVPDGVWVIVAD
jgi:hypothetical protein